MRNYISSNEISFGDTSDLLKLGVQIDLKRPYEKGGLPLCSDAKSMIVSTSDTHSLTLGTTGSRKTRSVVLPMVLNIAGANEKQSMVIHDTKGDVPKYTYDYLISQGYEVYVLNFRNPVASDHYNIFDTITDTFKTNRRKAKRMLADISNQLFEESVRSEKDPYWLSTVSEYFAGLLEALCIFTDYNKEYVNFSNIMELHRLIKNGKTQTLFIKHLLTEKKHFNVVEAISSVVDNASDTKKNLLSMVSNPFSTFESIRDLTYKSDFSAKALATKPVCLFLVTPDESDEYNFMISLIVKQIYGELLDFATTNKDNALPITVNFIIDEFGSLPRIDSFNSMISAARSRNVRFHLILQTFSQLREVYNEFGANNIFNNCQTVVCMCSNDNELEKILRDSIGKTTLPYSNKEIDLVPPGTLRTLDKGQVIILAQGSRNPFMVRLPDISQYDCYELSCSDCMDRFRANEEPIFDFDSLFNAKNITNESEIFDDSMVTERIINEFLDRKSEIESYHKHKYPVMITENLRRISREQLDITIHSVTYGMEIEMMEALLNITHDSEKSVAVAVAAISDEGDDLLIRCQNRKQFDNAVKLLEPLGRIDYSSSDSGKHKRVGIPLLDFPFD